MWSIKLRKHAAIFVLFFLVLMLGYVVADAQETTKISGKITATYTYQDSLVVGDMNGHNLSMTTSEGKNVSTGEHAFMDSANVNNMSFSDLIQGSGVHQGYVKFTQNGDATFAKWEGNVTTVQTAEGELATSFEGVFEDIKGTGKYENIKGNGTFNGEFISKTEYFAEWQAGYSIGK